MYLYFTARTKNCTLTEYNPLFRGHSNKRFRFKVNLNGYGYQCKILDLIRNPESRHTKILQNMPIKIDDFLSLISTNLRLIFGRICKYICCCNHDNYNLEFVLQFFCNDINEITTYIHCIHNTYVCVCIYRGLEKSMRPRKFL